MPELHVHDQESGFKQVAVTNDYEDTRARFVLFDILHHKNELFFYFHTWYKKYGNAIIALYRCTDISDDSARLISTISDSSFNREDLEESWTDTFVEDLLETLRGLNLIVVFRRNKHDHELPITVVSYSPPVDSSNKLMIKPSIRIPKLLLPRFIKTKKPQKSITDLFKKSVKKQGAI